jgi:hypothetical protein
MYLDGVTQRAQNTTRVRRGISVSRKSAVNVGEPGTFLFLAAAQNANGAMGQVTSSPTKRAVKITRRIWKGMKYDSKIIAVQMRAVRLPKEAARQVRVVRQGRKL